MTEFVAWPKTPRLYRDVVITEKIDGTNACIVIAEHEPGWHEESVQMLRNLGDHNPDFGTVAVVTPDVSMFDQPGVEYWVYAQSRTRIITPNSDNFGFATWVRDNAQVLAHDLGPGRHYGEWWGQGIQRKYGLDHKRFSLFNVSKWAGELESSFKTEALTVVPLIYEGTFSDEAVQFSLDYLRDNGSVAAPGFLNPEGVCVFHTQSRQVYKVLLENDDLPKSAVK